MSGDFVLSRRLLPAAMLAVIALALGVTACKPSGTQDSQREPSLGSAPPTTTNSIPQTSAPSAAPRAAPAPEPVIRYSSGLPLPNRALTPGEAFAGVGPSSFCISGYTTRVRNVTQAERYQAFAEYHIPYAQHSAYEVDHLIPLELGGDNSLKNLWPEKGSLPNTKDGLENQLHNMVCHGQLSAATAQYAIASNWVTALHTYGSTRSVYERSTSSTTSSTKTTTASGPAGATAKCVDGTYSYALHHQGACSHHGGVAVWYR